MDGKTQEDVHVGAAGLRPQRKGQCINCGACCRLPVECPFLKTNGDGKGYCGVYPLRPLNCRKYPRTDSEHITKDTCGFHFE